MNRLILAALITLTFTGCAKNTNLDPIDNAKTASEDRDLQAKNFTTSCTPKAFGTLVGSQIVYRFEGANVVRTTRYYKTNDCSSDADITFVEHGDFALHTDQRTADGGKAIDIDYKSVIVTTVTQQGVTAANAINLCGASDWSQNSQREENQHAADINCLNAQIPRHDSNIYRVDANVLYFGNTSDKSTEPGQRPTQLDMGTKYTAQ